MERGDVVAVDRYAERVIDLAVHIKQRAGAAIEVIG
jgi:hypothetical protein